jgi:hypothetical protein
MAGLDFVLFTYFYGGMKKLSGAREITEAQLRGWGHEGTVESAKKIRDFMDTNEDEELEAYAELAYGDAIYSAYSPKDDKEERDFLLGRMIYKAERRMCDLFVKKFPLQRKQVEGDVARAIHGKLMKQLSNAQKEEWKYNFSQDYYTWARGRLEKVEDEIAYLEVWLKQAKKMFVLEKYRNAPSEVYEDIYAGDARDPFEGEGEFD